HLPGITRSHSYFYPGTPSQLHLRPARSTHRLMRRRTATSPTALYHLPQGKGGERMVGQTYCNYMMWCLSQKIHMCKLTHTFIHAPTSRLWAICNSGGGRYNQYNKCDSFAVYPLTTRRVHSPPPTELCLQGNTPDPQDPPAPSHLSPLGIRGRLWGEDCLRWGLGSCH
uniref:Ribonuclease A-domain domain-containing protein n=1 Tax=Gopherus agassizii TaxID=38772 RepID=A0A452GHL3_9SAUR